MSAQGPSSADETITLRDAFISQGRGVPFENGWSWLAAAWSIFKRAAGVWIGMIIVLLLIYIVLGVVPVVGAIASLVAGPIFTGGLNRSGFSPDAPDYPDLCPGADANPVQGGPEQYFDPTAFCRPMMKASSSTVSGTAKGVCQVSVIAPIRPNGNSSAASSISGSA